MKKYLYFALILCLWLVLLNFSSGPPSGYTGADGITCSSLEGGCHSDENYLGSIDIDFNGVTIFDQGVTYPVAVTLCYGQMSGGTTPFQGGFSMTARDLFNNSYGSFIAGPNTSLGANNHVQHSPAQPFGTDSCVTYNFEYVAPTNPTSSAPVFFSAAAVIGSGDAGNQNDEVVSLNNPVEVLLPLELISFDIKRVSQGVLVSWSTAFESETGFFVIQRISQNETWEDIKNIPAAGISLEPRHYSYIDKLPILNSRLGYRLKIVDLDGSVTYSYIQSLKFDRLVSDAQFYVYPNPVKKGEDISIIGIADDVEEVFIVLSNGSQLDITDRQMEYISTDQLPTGMAVLGLMNKNGEVFTSAPFIIMPD